MARFINSRSKAAGQAPGSLIFIGNQKMEKPHIKLIEYDTQEVVEKEIAHIDEVAYCLHNNKVSWININGLHDLKLIERIGEIFNIHPLFLEDLLNTDQRPTLENGDTYDAFILKMLSKKGDDSRIYAEQLTVILGEHYVLTIQEKTGDVFEPVRQRIRNNKGRVRLNDNDYLAYALMDTVIDNYIYLVEGVGQQIEEMEDQIFLNKDKNLAEEIYKHKTELNFLRKSIRPVREIMLQLLKSEDHYFQDKNIRYLNDLNDLVIQVTDTVELYSNMLTDQLNIYNTNVSNRMNEVMKVLTIFAAIFIPLTFLAGIYGMNFEYIPELGFKYSYPIFWLIVLILGGGLVIFFKRKKWF